MTRPVGRVGSGDSQNSWVQSDLVIRRSSKAHGQGGVGSGQDGFKSHGTGRITLPRPDP